MSNEITGPTRQQIELLAYEFYVARGREAGHEVEDWLNAEAELNIDFKFAPSIETHTTKR